MNNNFPDEDVLKSWQKQYFLPSEAGAESRTLSSKKHLYRPPKTDTWGIAVACAVIGCWAALFIHAMWVVKLPWAVAPGEKPSSWLHIAAVFFSLEFLYTGLFITTHDAMHGTIALRNRRLNDALGWLAISLYAWFDYRVLHRKHWEHHNHTGIPRLDPDFHTGNPALPLWFARFMWSYMTPMQFIKIAAWSNLLLAAGAPIANQMVFMTAAPILSAFRLFYYGTYVPHHPPKGHAGPMPWHVSRSSSAPRLLSLLTCYHFDLHWEHHRWPYAPWWQLPACRELLRAAAVQEAAAGAAAAGKGAAGTEGEGKHGMKAEEEALLGAAGGSCTEFQECEEASAAEPDAAEAAGDASAGAGAERAGGGGAGEEAVEALSEGSEAGEAGGGDDEGVGVVGAVQLRRAAQRAGAMAVM